MSIENKLSQWQQAGLIDGATRARIEAFERSNERPVLLYALGGLGAVTIGIGVISIVAANWDAIDRSVKLAVDLLIGLALAAGIYNGVSRNRPWQTEIITGINYLFVLASLALLGQIYQLGTPSYQALLAWSLCTAPMMLLVQTPLLGFLWLSGLVWTHAETAAYFLDALEQRSNYDGALFGNALATTAFVSLAAYLCLARIPWMVRHRPAVSATWTHALWAATACGALVLCFAFYDRIDSNDVLTWSIGIAAVVMGCLAFALPRLYPWLSDRALLGARLLFGMTWLILAASLGFARESVPAAGACTQVVMLAVIAWTALQLGQLRLFNVLTGFIALRVLTMYFEVFGSMLSTGVGMISGGLLTLLLAWVWKRKSPELAALLVSDRTDTTNGGPQ